MDQFFIKYEGLNFRGLVYDVIENRYDPHSYAIGISNFLSKNSNPLRILSPNNDDERIPLEQILAEKFFGKNNYIKHSHPNYLNYYTGKMIKND